MFVSAWVFDHFYPLFSDSSGPCLKGWTALTALAQATSRLRLGCRVTGIHYRHLGRARQHGRDAGHRLRRRLGPFTACGTLRGAFRSGGRRLLYTQVFLALRRHHLDRHPEAVTGGAAHRYVLNGTVCAGQGKLVGHFGGDAALGAGHED